MPAEESVGEKTDSILLSTLAPSSKANSGGNDTKSDNSGAEEEFTDPPAIPTTSKSTTVEVIAFSSDTTEASSSSTTESSTVSASSEESTTTSSSNEEDSSIATSNSSSSISSTVAPHSITTSASSTELPISWTTAETYSSSEESPESTTTLLDAIALAEEEANNEILSDEALTKAFESATIAAEVVDQNLAGLVEEIHDSIVEVLDVTEADDNSTTTLAPSTTTTTTTTEESIPASNRSEPLVITSTSIEISRSSKEINLEGNDINNLETTTVEAEVMPEFSTEPLGGGAENNTIDLGIFGSFWLQTARAISVKEWEAFAGEEDDQEEEFTTLRPEPVFRIEDYTER